MGYSPTAPLAKSRNWRQSTSVIPVVRAISFGCSHKFIFRYLVWQPGQGVKVDHAAIVQILINQLDEEREPLYPLISNMLRLFISEDDEIQQSIALKWLYEFLTFAQDVVVPFTPRLIPAVLPSLAHHAPDIQTAAIKLNQLLFNVIQNLPSTTPAVSPAQGQPQALSIPNRNASVATSSPGRSGIPIPHATGGSFTLLSTSPQQSLTSEGSEMPNKLRPIPPILEQPLGTVSSNSSQIDKEGAISSSRPSSPPPDSERKLTAPVTEGNEEVDPFDYHATVSALTVKFLSEYEDTRVAALKWLIMLHQKVPHKVSIDYNPELRMYSTHHRSWPWMTEHSRHCSRTCRTRRRKSLNMICNSSLAFPPIQTRVISNHS